MIKLHPIPDVSHHCLFDNTELEVIDWYIPGMRNLADLKCPACAREYYGDLPTGQALYSPMLLDKATGLVHGDSEVQWFADWLRLSHANRVNSPIGFAVEEFRPLKQVVLLNCLDTLYGHCLLKLLNAQYYLDHLPNLDLVVMVPRFLRWLVPDGVAAIWTVDVPLRRGIEWNDWLAAELKRRIESLPVCWLSVAFSHPHPENYEIERFTRIRPFQIEEWGERLESPVVTFIWREDRIWEHTPARRFWQGVTQSLKRNLRLTPNLLEGQERQVVALAQALRRSYPNIDFAIAGMGRSQRSLGWITDLRFTQLNEDVERAWCIRYAKSHLVIGIHGSNMLLPSGHAGAVVELMPNERWGNVVQDFLFRGADTRENMLRYHVVPLSTSPGEVAVLIDSLLRLHDVMMLLMGSKSCHHRPDSGARQYIDLRQDFKLSWLAHGLAGR